MTRPVVVRLSLAEARALLAAAAQAHACGRVGYAEARALGRLAPSLARDAYESVRDLAEDDDVIDVVSVASPAGGAS